MRVTPQCDAINTIVICQADSMQAGPAVAFDGTNYIVVFNDKRLATNRILATRVTPQGSVLDAGNFIGKAGDDEQAPDIVDGGTRCFAVWGAYNVPYGVKGRFVDDLALPLDTVIRIATTSTYKYMNPKVAAGGSRYLVVYNDMIPATADFNVCAQLVSAQGQLLGGKISISETSRPEMEPNVVFYGNRFLVAWNDSGLIKGCYIDTLGQIVGSSFLISAPASWMRSAPGIAVSGSNTLVAWEEMRTTKDIYANLDLTFGTGENSSGTAFGSKPRPLLFGSAANWISRRHKVYDISGRIVTDRARLRPGIYFVELGGDLRYKILQVE